MSNSWLGKGVAVVEGSAEIVVVVVVAAAAVAVAIAAAKVVATLSGDGGGGDVADIGTKITAGSWDCSGLTSPEKGEPATARERNPN